MTQSNSRSARDGATHLHGYTNAVKHEAEGAMVVAGGKGVWVHDEDGKLYLEGMAGLWSASLGFDEPRLVEAALRQLKALPFYHTFTHKVPAVTVDLAEKLVAIAPAPMSRAFFASSGSEANDSVVKMVWYYNNALGRPRKKKIVSRIKGYHGVTVAAASLTGLPSNHRDFDLPIANILHADCPHHYRYGEPGESEADFGARMAANLEALILREGPETIAAFIAEPVQGAGGVIIPPAGYFERVQAILKKYDILFVADEVICGFGRTGNMFGCQTYGLRPDIITMAKALSASYLPISAVLVNRKVYEPIRDNSAKIGVLGHGFTYGGHPVSAAVALEALKLYEERDIVGHVRRVAPRFLERLHGFADHPMVGETRGVGLVGAIELVSDKRARTPFDPALAVAANCIRRCEAHGLIIRAILDGAVFCPPLIISEAEIDEMFDRFARALDETHVWVRDQGLASVA